MRGSFQGTAPTFAASLQSQPWLTLIALVAIYIVLGVLYDIPPDHHYLDAALRGRGSDPRPHDLSNGIQRRGVIGIFLLIGIVKKNAIMMMDFALDAKSMGKNREAMYEACLLRFRPIMMTTMTALLGAMPLVVGGGAGSELRRPLGIDDRRAYLSQMLTLCRADDLSLPRFFSGFGVCP